MDDLLARLAKITGNKKLAPSERSENKPSNRIDDLDPDFRESINRLIERGKREGVSFKIRETYRPKEVQDDYYAQGRTKPGAIITHAKGGQSDHQYRTAIDLDPSDGDYKKVGRWAKELGLKWGGDWDWKDWGHIYLDDIRKGRKPASVAPARPDLTERLQGITKDIPQETDLLGRLQSITKGAQPSPTTKQPVAQVTIPEPPETIDAQHKSAIDPKSPRGAVLVNADQVPANTNLKRVDLPDGRVLLVNDIKVPDFANKTVEELIGKVEPVKDTSKGRTLVTKDAKGTELSASIVSPENVEKQKQVDLAQFPQAKTQEVVDAEKVKAERMASLQKEYDDWRTELSLPNDQPTVDRFNNERKTRFERGQKIDRLGRIGESASQEQLSPDAAYGAFIEKGGLPDNQDSVNLFNQDVERRNAESGAKYDEARKNNKDYQAFLKDTGLTDSPETVEEFNTVQQTLNKHGVPTQEAVEKWLKNAPQQNGSPIRQPRPQTPPQATETPRISAPRGVGKPTDDLNRVAYEFTVPEGVKSDEEAISIALKQGGLTDGQIQTFIANRKRDGIPLLGRSLEDSRTIQIPYHVIEEAGGQVTQREEQAQNRVEPQVPTGTPGLLPESEAEKELEKRIAEPDYSFTQNLGEMISKPWEMLSPVAGAKLNDTSPEFVQREKDRLLKQHGSYSKAWEAERYYQNASAPEIIARAGNQTLRSFAKNLGAGTAKSAVFLGDLWEKAALPNYNLPDEYKVGTRNAGNVLDFITRLTFSGAKQAYEESKANWVKGGDISQQQLFRAAQEFDKAVGDDPVLKGRFWGSVADAGGSAASFIALGAVMPSLQVGKVSLGTGLAGIAQTAGSGYEEGKNAGLNEQDAVKFGLIQGALGMSEMIGAGASLTKFIKNPSARRNLALGILEAAKKESKQEFAQEVFQSTGGKAALEYLKDNEPDAYQKVLNALNRLPKQLGETVANEGVIGALVGGIVGGAGSALSSATAIKENENEINENAPAQRADDRQVAEVKTDDGTGTPVAGVQAQRPKQAEIEEEKLEKVPKPSPQMEPPTLAKDKPAEVQAEVSTPKVGQFKERLSADELIDHLIKTDDAVERYESDPNERKQFAEDLRDQLQGATAALKRIPLKGLKPNSGAIDNDVVEQYASLDTEPPPIVVRGNEIFDGNHRATMLRNRGEKEVWAYVIEPVQAEGEAEKEPIKETNAKTKKAETETVLAEQKGGGNHPVEIALRHYDALPKGLGSVPLDQTTWTQIAQAMTPAETSATKRYIDSLPGDDYYEKSAAFKKQVRLALNRRYETEATPIPPAPTTKATKPSKPKKIKVSEDEFQAASKALSDFREGYLRPTYGNDWMDKATPEEIEHFKALSTREKKLATGQSAAPVPPLATEKGFDITAQTGQKGIGVARIKELRDEANRKAETSSVTGLPNKAAFEKALPRVDADPNMEVTSIDLNNFKSINDKNDHITGDKALKDAGKDLLDAAKDISEQAQIFHLSGDEFAVVSPKGTGKNIKIAADEKFSKRKYGEVSASIGGFTAPTYAKAEAGLQQAKKERKGGGIARPKEFYIYNHRTKNFEQPQKAKAVRLSVDGDFFVHRSVGDHEWVISEGRTGSKIATGQSVADVKRQANSVMEQATKTGAFEKAVEKNLRSSGLSPRYDQEPATIPAHELQKPKRADDERGDGDVEGSGRGSVAQAPKANRGLTNAEIAAELNRFTKAGDLHRFHRRIANYTRDEKIRVVENLRAGDDPATAIKDAKGYVEPVELRHGGFPFLNSLFGDRQRADEIGGVLDDSNPEVERRFREAEGIRQPSILTKAKRAVVAIGQSFKRTYPHLNPNKDQVHAASNDLFRQLDAAPHFAKAYAADNLARITENLGKDRTKLFTRALILPDIMKDIEAGLYDGKDLPFGFKDKAELQASIDKYNALVEKTPAVKDAIEKRQKFIRELTQNLVDYQLLDPKVLEDDRYYHRQVMDYVNDPAFVGAGGRDARIKKKGFQKGRVGGGDFNTRYVEAEFEFISQAQSLIVRKEILDRFNQVANIKNDLIREAEILSRNGDEVTWQDIIPEGYATWQPKKGNYFYPALSIAERRLDDIIENGEPVLETDIKKVLALGGQRETWVVPEQVAKTLDEFNPDKNEHPIEGLWTAGQNAWKQWTLLSPPRVLKYNLNNMSGDLDIAFAYDPKIVKNFKRAAQDLWRYQISGKARDNAEILEAIKLGVVDSGLSITEIPDINKAGAFRVLLSDNPNILQQGIEKWWGGVKNFTNWRENILRLAAYRYFKDQVAKGNKVYGASTKKQIDAIEDPDEKAAKLARELVGDYGAVSNAGQWIRRHLIPFYSWMEINAPRYVRMLKNVPYEEGANARKARMAGVVAGRTAVGVVKLGVQANLLMLAAQLFNHLMFPDEEDEMRNTREARTGHLIIGRREDGTPRTIRIAGALQDALDWFGAGDIVADVNDLYKGKATWRDKAAEAVKAPVEKAANSWEPVAKTAFELALGKSAYPSIFRKGTDFSLAARPIRDRKEYVARLFSLDSLYRFVMGRPKPPTDTSDPLGVFLDWTVAYRIDPQEAAYWNAKTSVAEWAKKRGKEWSGGEPTNRSNALYHYKQAMKWGDKKAAEKFLKEYMELGGSKKGMRSSETKSHPLGSIARRDWNEYKQSLTPEQLEELEIAIKHWRAMFGKDVPENE